MTAGKGVLHSEMFPLLHSDRNNPLELFQIWLNLPRKHKLVEPHFRMLWHEEIPIYQHEDENGLTTSVDIIAGNLMDIKALRPTPNSWAADANNQVAIWTIKIDANAHWVLPAAEPFVNRSLYYYRGNELLIEGTKVSSNHRISIIPDQKIAIQNGFEDSHLLLLQGRPIKEPVAQHGPFVMNTSAEIQEAFGEFRRTHFGGWPWPKNDQVHEQAKGRFALHADGELEEK
jgi:redox-sensitive bicupin YhaK (pirin superfamily)